MTDSFIVDGVRTPIGRFGGSLSGVRTDDLAALVVKELAGRFRKIPPNRYDDVVLGCSNQAGEDNRNVSRMALLLAGLPWSVPGETVNRLCASGMSAVIHAHRAILAGDGDLYISGGVENMTRGPWVISKASSPFGRDSEMYDSSFGWRFINPRMRALYGTDSMGETAENLVSLYDITREDQDKFAFWSQQKATAALKKGRFSKEILPVRIAQKKSESYTFSDDEFIRPETTLRKLSELKPIFKPAGEGGSVTVGNASGLNDGAAAILVASASAVESYDLKPLARIVTSGVTGVEPAYMGIGPVGATQIALKKASLSMEDIDIIELNEAFAGQVLACTRQWGLDDDDPRLNPNGGAIALGHPLGMTGARILLTASLELNIRSKRYALVTMCVGVGQGYAVILERV